MRFRISRIASTTALAAAAMWPVASGQQPGGKSKLECRVKVSPLPGDYEGSYSAILKASGGELPTNVQFSLTGSLRVKAVHEPRNEETGEPAGTRITAGDGDLAFQYGSNTSLYGGMFGANLTAAATGNLEFESATPLDFVMHGTVGGFTLNASGHAPNAKAQKSVSSTGGSSSLRFAFSEYDDCWTLTGIVGGATLAATVDAFRAQGLDAHWSDTTFKLALTDDHGLKQAADEVRQKMAEVDPHPRANALKRFRQIYDDMAREAANRPEAERKCLNKPYMEGYFPNARVWLKEDLAQIDTMNRHAATLTDLDKHRLHRLIGQALGRAAEANLAGCGWSEADGAMSKCADAAIAVEQALLKKKFNLWDATTVAEIQQWFRQAMLLGGNDGGQALAAAAAWASKVAWEKYHALEKTCKSSLPMGQDACTQAYDEAFAAMKQAQLTGGDHPGVDLVTSYCKEARRCS